MPNMSIINVNTLSAITQKYRNEKREHFLNFSNRCIKNPFVKEYHLRQKSICAWCGKPINPGSKWCLHHMDYDHLCITDEVMRIPFATPKRPNKTRKVPDCKKCSQENCYNFLQCMSKLVPVHWDCNGEIAGIKGQQLQNFDEE